MLKITRWTVLLIILFLFGCRPQTLPTPAPPSDMRRVDYVLIPADTNGSAVLCVEVTFVMKLDQYLGPNVICGETVDAFRQRVRNTRVAN